ncbi:MAG: Mfa1 fimbrilin C-terminal domain-containing protein [Muribaculaceae bacterium]|nr:Mfa1 fimbrilin C-terminal domain-containing protein [Muribaculaceae bacterium]
MKLKFRNILPFLAIPLAFAFAGCKDDALMEQPIEPTPLDELPYVSILLNISLPSENATRSITEEDGTSDAIPDTEDGRRNENQINDATIYFYRQLTQEEQENISDEDKAAYLLAYGNDLKLVGSPMKAEIVRNNSATSYTLSAKVDIDAMKQLAGGEVYVFIATNLGDITPTTNGNNMAGNHYEYDPRSLTLWLYEKDFLDFGTDDNGKTVFMSNAEEFKANFTDLKYNPAETDEQFVTKILAFINNAPKKEHNLSEGSKILKLERSLARVDYKQAKGKRTDKLNFYQVGTINNLYASLESLQLFNNHFKTLLYRQTCKGNNEKAYVNGYDDYLQRKNISLFGIENGGDIIIPGPTEEDEPTIENSYNWVIDGGWNSKIANNPGEVLLGVSVPTSYRQGDKVIFSDLTTNFGRISIEELDKRNAVDGFIPWRYMGENTHNSVERMRMKNSTGVAFRMRLSKANGDYFTGDDASTLFLTGDAYNQKLTEFKQAHDTWENDKKEAEKTPGIEFTDPEPIFEIVNGKLVDASATFPGYYALTIGEDTVYVKALKEDEENPDMITSFEITYWYFFRHNYDKTQEVGIVKPMQFGVVRNNIYKLSVTSLNGLPRPFDPEAPDEPQENDIAVEMAILSWARVDKNIVL